MGVTLGRGLKDAAEDAVRNADNAAVNARFSYASASYLVMPNGPPEEGASYCGSLKIGERRYSVYLLTTAEE